MSWIKFLLVLSVCVWVGSIVFFAAGAAPATLQEAPNRFVAGAMINVMLSRLHWIGTGCGIAYIFFSSLLSSGESERIRPLRPAHLLVALMIAFALTSQFIIMPAMARLRGATAPPFEQEFMRLHAWSVALDLLTLILGLVLLYLTVRRLDS